MVAPIEHVKEAERLLNLESYHLVNVKGEKDLDELTYLAAKICEVPIALISIITKEKQWFKSKIGLEISETMRENSFCAHAINNNEDIFEVEDTSQDERFFDNPLVTNEPQIVFYAGAILRSENNLPLGTICVIDRKPRKLNKLQILAIKAIAKQIMYLFELKKSKNQLIELQDQLLKTNEELRIKKNIIEEKNNDFLRSLNYAKRIQEAILPDKAEIRKIFPESFIFYRPKEIISGDFYWFKSKNGFVFGAAVDCTGHGIPGALMSMLGFKCLNRIILVLGVLEPGNILEQFNTLVIETLKEGIENESISDGMDLALFRFNPLNNELVFAGANRPLYLLIDGELIEAQPNKSGIGGSILNHPTFQRFISKTYILKPKDRFFIFTDGVIDQFNNEGKKILAKRLKESILKGASLSLIEQKKQLQELFLNWQGAEEQTDDVLFMGFEVPDKKGHERSYTSSNLDVTSFFVD
jgi:serine phosphatase RsbU (regulator of sigma subunit)